MKFLGKKITSMTIAAIAMITNIMPLQVKAEAFSYQLIENAPYITGDVNFNRKLDDEDISIIATSIIQKKFNTTKLTQQQNKIADADGNGVVENNDVAILKNILDDNLSSFDVEVIYGIKTYCNPDTISMYDGFPTPTARGLDVSTWQWDINWEEVVNTGVDFVIIRAGYGQNISQEDSKFRYNIEKAQELGLDVGVYWYSYAKSVKDAIAEAETCYEIIKGNELQYPVYFDIEENSQVALGKETVSDIIDAFCQTIKSKGYYPAVYTYASFLNSCVRDDILETYDIWFADYILAQSHNPYASYGGNFTGWQYASSGYSEGINGNIDLDFAYRNYPALFQKYGINKGN